MQKSVMSKNLAARSTETMSAGRLHRIVPFGVGQNSTGNGSQVHCPIAGALTTRRTMSKPWLRRL